MVSVPVIITVYGHMVQAGNIATANHKYNHKYNNISGVSPYMYACYNTYQAITFAPGGGNIIVLLLIFLNL